MKNLKVENIANNGKSVPNQFLISYIENNKEYKIFQSYSSIILKWENGNLIEVGADWDYSRTTGKYRNILIRMNKKEFEKILYKLFEWDENTQSYLRKK
jgi:hypothetical protein